MPTPTELAAAMLGGLDREYPAKHYSYGFVHESRRIHGRFVDVLILQMVSRETGQGYALEVTCVPILGGRRS